MLTYHQLLIISKMQWHSFKASFTEMPKISFRITHTSLKFHWNLPESNELISCHPVCIFAAYWHGMSTCVSPDQDPADMCNPVNCVLKYNGQLNYYNASSYRCQKITSCVSDDSSDLPAKVGNWCMKYNRNIWVRSRICGCLVTWFCYQLIPKPGNKTATVPWPDPYTHG